MENKDAVSVPYIVHEAAMARQERTIKRLWILCLALFAALVVTNAGWIWYESQFVDTVVEQEVDTGDGGAYVSGIGDVIYGTDKADGKDQAEEDGR